MSKKLQILYAVKRYVLRFPQFLVYYQQLIRSQFKINLKIPKEIPNFLFHFIMEQFIGIMAGSLVSQLFPDMLPKIGIFVLIKYIRQKIAERKQRKMEKKNE